MKKYQYIFILISVIGLFSCKKDNYDAPSSELSGRLVYQGEPIYVEYDRVNYEVYQFGFGKTGALPGTFFDQDGSYSLLLFNGEYKLLIPNGQGPFIWNRTASGAPDSLTINVSGNQTLDLEVTPYYMVRNAKLSGSNDNVSGSFGLEKIITNSDAKDIDYVALYINKTLFVSPADNIASTTLNSTDISSMDNIELEVEVPSMTPSQNYVFARIGVKIAGVEDMIFSHIEKIQL